MNSKKMNNSVIRKTLLIILAVGFISNSWSQTIPTELQTPDVVSVNRMPMRQRLLLLKTRNWR
jgi:hypothetical protein